VSTDGGLEPAWSRDGKRIVYEIPDPPPNNEKARFFEVDVAESGDTLTLGRPHLLFETYFDGATVARSWDMTPDAQRLLISREGYQPTVTAPREIEFVQGWLDELRVKAGGAAR
jgi:hypothetical protein